MVFFLEYGGIIFVRNQYIIFICCKSTKCAEKRNFSTFFNNIYFKGRIRGRNLPDFGSEGFNYVLKAVKIIVCSV
jgi:hypothetical protein